MQRILVCGVLLGFVACTRHAEPSPAGPVVRNPDRVTCVDERPTGSMMERRICRTDLQRSEDWRRADTMYRDLANQRY